MRFRVEEPDLKDVRVRYFESDTAPFPHMCHNLHANCSHTRMGSCHLAECTCETTGNCVACPPPPHLQGRIP